MLTNKQCIEVAEIGLPCGRKTIVDNDDYEFLTRYKWKYSGGGVRRWASRDGKQFGVLMHREIMNCLDDKEVDHINRNPLDNRKANLRLATRQQNCMNTGPMKGKTSTFKGVHWNTKRRRWIAKININGKSIQLGSFHDEFKAAKSYDIGAKKHFGEFAYFNFEDPDNPSTIVFC